MSFPKEFSNKYDSKDSEERIRKFWEEKKVFKFDENTKKEIFSIDTPPPTVSGKMHIGHAFSYTQQDFIARYMRMSGKEVYYPFGTDDNGLATEKLVQKEKKVDLRRVSRDEAIKVCLEFLDEERPKFIQDFKNVGLSCDFDLAYSSINDYSRQISQKSFLDLAKKDLVYRKEGPVMWDRVFQTAIAQAELEDKKLKSTLNYIKSKIKGTKDTYLIYATTRPELLHACVGMSVEDIGDYVKLKVGKEFWITGAKTYEDKFKDFEFEVVEKLKGSDFIGEICIIPISGNEVEIGHDISVKADYGTGIVYYCTYGGLDCVEWMSRNPKVKPINILNKNGSLNKKAGKYEGMIASTDARVAVIDDLEKEGHLIKKEKLEHMVNVGERSGAEVEYITSHQWYVNYLDKKEYFFEQAQKFNWTPSFMKHRIENWIKGLNWDWGFSRQRHFGIPIPVWYCKKCEEIKFADESQLPIDPLSSNPLSPCEKCGSKDFIPENDVFDTWFTSASSPELAINLMKDKPVYKKLWPMSLRPQGHDIINFWLFYTMAKNNLLYNENPFKDVNISGWVLAADGSKMSKSKGNTIVPQVIVEKYSNDSLRFAASSAKLGSDLPFQEKEVQTGIKVINKLYNANKFASMLLDDFKAEEREQDYEKLNSIDKWIIAKMQIVIEKSTKCFQEYDYQKAKSLWVDFFMNDVADNYIEIIKERLWKKQGNYKSAQKTLYYVLYNSLKGLAPFMPFITEEIYQIFYKNFETEESVHKASYPKIDSKGNNRTLLIAGEQFVNIVKEVRKYKSERNMSLKEEIETYDIECFEETKEFIENSKQDLLNVCGIKKLNVKEKEIKIAINGLGGSFLEQALTKLLDSKEISFSFEETKNNLELASLIDNKTKLGTITLENLETGSFGQNYDLLLEGDFEIVAEFLSKPNYCLMASKDVDISKINKVYSHHQILSQCSTFINRNNIMPIAFENTTTAANHALEKFKENKEISGVIGSEELAKKFKMKVIKKDFHNSKNNTNRFLLIKKKGVNLIFEDKLQEENLKDKTSLFFDVKDEPSALYKSIGGFATNNVNITKLESRPNKKDPNGYLFYMEFEGSSDDINVKKAIEELELFSKNVKFLGTYKKRTTL